DVLVYLGRGPRSREHDRNPRALQYPRQGQDAERYAAAARQGLEPLDRGAAAGELAALEPVDARAVVARGKLWRSDVLAREETSGERPVGEERKPALAAQRQLALLHVAVEQVVGSLVGGERYQLECAGELPVGSVAQPDRACLAFPLQPVQLVEPPFHALD